MTSQPLYRLADPTFAEPLVNGWTAWWLNVAPVPACLHLHGYQIPLLRAYLQTPDFHFKAAKDRALSGSSFVDVPPARAGEVKALLQKMQADQADCIKLAEAYEEFQGWLLAEARGQSLEPLYEKLPEPLKGRVELIYDYNNRPFVRFMEGMFYRSRYYKRNLQSLRLGVLPSDSARSTFLTTPRLHEPGQLDWQVPFDDERLDKLFLLDLEPRPLGYVRELLGSAVKSDEEVLPLLSEAPLPPPAAPWDGPTPRVRYLGHASVLVEWKGVSILVDPVISSRPIAEGLPRVTFQQLPARIDYVLITHNHPDHLDFETLLRLRHRIGHLVMPRSGGLLVGDFNPRLLGLTLGIRSVHALDTYESLPLPDGEILATPFLGEHGDLGHSKSGWLIRAGQEKILLVADSMCVDDNLYRHLRQDLGDIQTVFMNTEIEGAPHTWTMEGLFPKKRDRKMEKNRRCRGSTRAEGLRLLELVGARRLYNYAMGLEPWMERIIGPAATAETPRMKESDLLLAEFRSRGGTAERLYGATELRLGN
ncbi:MAG TPA: MBL fold metallo-hydrolase [Archangium sp.]|nr:MBL fold metallo-hydrolase [Archangium sp.]